MKNLTSPNEPLQANEAEEGSCSLEADQRTLYISIIPIIYTLATATATPALPVYSWTLMQGLSALLPAYCTSCSLPCHMPRPHEPGDTLLTEAWPISLQQGGKGGTGVRISTQQARVQLALLPALR